METVKIKKKSTTDLFNDFLGMHLLNAPNNIRDYTCSLNSTKIN